MQGKTFLFYSKTTANIHNKKWSSHSNSVFVGHRCPKTAKITKGMEGKE
jgi:hypothetical protein